MVRDLVLAIGIPIALLLVATAVLERWGDYCRPGSSNCPSDRP